MTDEELAAIEARARAATPGPWSGEPGGVVSYAGDTWTEQERADVLFTTHARADVPKLLAELRKARAVLAEVQWASNGWHEANLGGSCPICGGARGSADQGLGHEPDCALAAALGKA